MKKQLSINNIPLTGYGQREAMPCATDCICLLGDYIFLDMAKKKPMRIISNGKHKTHQINFDFDILESGWRTADTYDRDFKPTPEVCGVYFILASDFVYLKPKTIQQIIYVGCSSNLKKRYTNHPVIKNNYRKYSCLQFYFMPDNDYKKSEIALIKKIRPLLNIQHNG